MSSSSVGAHFGDLAQLVEHLLCKQGVRGSTPLVSTNRNLLPEMGGDFYFANFLEPEMSTMSPGWKTDLDILALTGSTITEHDDHLVVKTPHNPDYHWGNCILVLDPTHINDAQKWVNIFKQEFPEKDWLAVGLPVMPKDTGAWEAFGIELEQLDVLSTKARPNQVQAPDGYTTRAFLDSDWEHLTQREIADGISEGNYPKEAIESFVLETNATRRRLCEMGDAAWFGVFHGDLLVSNLGIIRCGTTGRYQSVETLVSHRRKGLASHLLGVAANWSAESDCDNWVIVTQETNDAGRVYRRAGFQADIASVNAHKRSRV